MNQDLIDINNMSKLQWACRRGMLELDVLLGNFLNEAYSALPDADKHLFVNLLSCPDPEIFAWLMGREEADPEHQSIVEKIRAHVRSRF